MPTSIDTGELRRLLTGGVQLMDVLPPKTYQQEHLPGAINVPLADIATAADRLDRSRAVAVYCYDYQ
jgi:rhodanese-related sulfurtransferase